MTPYMNDYLDAFERFNQFEYDPTYRKATDAWFKTADKKIVLIWGSISMFFFAMALCERPITTITVVYIVTIGHRMMEFRNSYYKRFIDAKIVIAQHLIKQFGENTQFEQNGKKFIEVSHELDQGIVSKQQKTSTCY